MDALALDRVEISRQRCDQSLALASAHLGDLAAVEHDAADHLDIEMAHPEHSDRGFANRGEGFGQDLIERLARGELLAELLGLRGQLLVGERLDLLLERVDLVDRLAHRADVAFVGRAEDGFGKGFEHERDLAMKFMGRCPSALWLPGRKQETKPRDRAPERVYSYARSAPKCTVGM